MEYQLIIACLLNCSTDFWRYCLLSGGSGYFDSGKPVGQSIHHCPTATANQKCISDFFVQLFFIPTDSSIGTSAVNCNASTWVVQIPPDARAWGCQAVCAHPSDQHADGLRCLCSPHDLLVCNKTKSSKTTMWFSNAVCGSRGKCHLMDAVVHWNLNPNCSIERPNTWFTLGCF